MVVREPEKLRNSGSTLLPNHWIDESSGYGYVSKSLKISGFLVILTN
jgi:hypothetical protein